MDKFEVGNAYFSFDTKYASDRETLIKVKKYWLCVKRNDATGYVSFRRVYKNGTVSSSQESRKVDYEWNNGKKLCEIVKIGSGGSGSWRNWDLIRADQKE